MRLDVRFGAPCRRCGSSRLVSDIIWDPPPPSQWGSAETLVIAGLPRLEALKTDDSLKLIVLKWPLKSTIVYCITGTIDWNWCRTEQTRKLARPKETGVCYGTEGTHKTSEPCADRGPIQSSL